MTGGGARHHSAGRRPFTGAVLTGGRSSRMGADKALVELDGRPLVARPLDALRTAGASELLAVGGDATRLGALAVTTVPDAHPGEGPLGGIVTALERAANDVVVVLPCDTPAVTAAFVQALLDRLSGETEAEAVVPAVSGRRVAVAAAYRAACVPRLRAAFEEGERAPHRAVAALRLVELTAVDPAVLADVDSPEELRRYAAGGPHAVEP